MTGSSSIFSFETLDKGSLVPSRPVVMAIVLVLCANMYAGSVWHRGQIFSSMPTGMLQECVEKTNRRCDVWLLGNSTLAKGVDESLLRELTKLQIAKSTFGSATLSAQCQLASFLLEQTTHPPSQIWLFVTKDDLNLNGARAEVSNRYLQSIEHPSFNDKLSSYVPVHACRLSIRQKLARMIEDSGKFVQSQLRGPKNKRSASSEPQGKKSFRDLGADFDTTYLTNLGRDYELDKGAFEELRQLEALHPSIDWHVVLPPVTHAPAKWQSKYASHLPWPQIKAELAGQLRDVAALHDLSGLLPGTTEYFLDAYHVNRIGANRLSEWLSDQVNK